MDLIFLKIGGSLITEKNKAFTEKREIIKRLAREIHEARKEKDFRLLIGNGGGSYPHFVAKKYQTEKGIINNDSYKGIAEVQDAASRLNRILVRALLDSGENAISVQPSSTCLSKRSRIKDFYIEPLKTFLKKNMVPVIYGDVILDLIDGCSIASTEELFTFLAKRLNPQRIIYGGIEDGVLDADPNKNSDAKLISEINLKNYQEIKKVLGGSAGIDVTGGMRHRVERCMELSELGIESYIINGLKENQVRDTLLGRKVKGTIVKTT